MTGAADAAPQRAAPSDASGRTWSLGRAAYAAAPNALPWLAAAALHGLIAALLMLAALVPGAHPPAPAPTAQTALIVDLVTPPPPVSAPPPASTAAPESVEAPPVFDLRSTRPAPPLPVPEVLRRLDAAPGEATAPGVPADVEQSLKAVLACRAGAGGSSAMTAADACPPGLRFAARADRAAAVDPFAFFDLDLQREARALDAAPRGPAAPLAIGRDARLSSADEMRDRLPPVAPDPAFGD